MTPDSASDSAGAAPVKGRGQTTILCLLLALVTLATFWPVRNYEFLNYDDPDYVTANPAVQGGLTRSGVAWAFTTGHASNWHPLTWLSHMLDAQLFGKSAAGPHVVNLLFHIANTLLLFLLLRRLTGAQWRSAFVAALFALHPLHVESVAWISERKDVLSAFFALLTLLTYVKRVTGKTSAARSVRSRVSFHLPLLFFALGLLAKPMLVTLPFVLLLLDWWPLKRIPGSGFRVPGSLLLEKIPFLVLAALSSAITFGVQQRGGAVHLEAISLSDRIGNAFISYARYLAKTFWPARLAIPYPHPGHWPWSWVAGAAAIVIALSAFAWLSRRRAPFVFIGWFWFFGMLVPVIGLIPIGAASLADRYTYLPSIGLFIVIAWSAGLAIARWKIPAPAVAVAAGALLLAGAARTRDQLGYWANSEKLFRHALALTENNFVAHDNLGAWLDRHGQWEEALEQYRAAVRINPNDFLVHDNIGFHWFTLGRLDEAIASYREALRINPRDPTTLNNLGSALARRRQFADAIRCYEAALRERPDYPDAHNNLGVALDETGRSDDAIRQYRAALQLAPDSAQTHNNLANALAGQNHLDEAIREYRLALQIDPGFAEALSNLGWVLAMRGEYAESIACYEKLLQAKPNLALAHKNLADVLGKTGRRAEAMQQYAEALRLQPDFTEARRALEALQGTAAP